MMEGEDYSPYSLPPPPPPPSATKIEPLTCPKQLEAPRKKKYKNRNKNMRRFNDEQIRSLESIFKSDKKLHPRKKLELAREVGLQPRQVAIWFQNKRARWKSKQIEEDYSILKANYDDLYARFESLKNEKQSLLFQLQKLSDLLKQPNDEEAEFKHFRENSSDGGSEFNEKPSCLNEEFNQGAAMYSDDERGNGVYFKQEEEPELVNTTGERVDDYDSLASPEKWCKLDSVGVLDQSCGSSNWWDFWT